MKIKNIIYGLIIILLFIGLFFISIYNEQWWLLTLLIIIAVLFGIIYILGLFIGLGFANKYPLDFLMITGWVNQYFKDNGFTEIRYDLDKIYHPATVFSKGDTNVKVIYNAETFIRESSISVIVSGDVEKKWIIKNENEDDVYKTFDEFFNENAKYVSKYLTYKDGFLISK